VQTAYLIAYVVMVPLSGMMSRLLSTRILFVVAALGFTGASALCATATSLGQMILYRAMQGFCGGAISAAGPEQFVADSAVEQAGFELSVPLATGVHGQVAEACR